MSNHPDRAACGRAVALLLFAPILAAAEPIGRFGVVDLAQRFAEDHALSADHPGSPESGLLAAITPAAEHVDAISYEPHQVNFAKRTAVDLWGIVASPARWDGSDWTIAGLCVAGTAATYRWIDGSLQEDSQETRNPLKDRWSKNVGEFGALYSFAVLGVAGAYGWIADDERAVHVLIDGLETTIIASGIISPTLKLAVGRARPNQTAEDSDEYHPFSGDSSFPSGHATQAFSVASVVAFSYPDKPWLGAMSFT